MWVGNHTGGSKNWSLGGSNDSTTTQSTGSRKSTPATTSTADITTRQARLDATIALWASLRPFGRGLRPRPRPARASASPVPASLDTLIVHPPFGDDGHYRREAEQYGYV